MVEEGLGRGSGKLFHKFTYNSLGAKRYPNSWKNVIFMPATKTMCPKKQTNIFKHI